MLSEVRTRSRKIRRAASVAAFSGWSMAIFAGFTLLAALFGDLIALALGGLLMAIAINELRAGALVRQLDPRGARRLGYNQIALGILIVAYAAWSLFATLRSPQYQQLAGSTGDASMDAMVRDLTGLLTYGLYGGMAIIGVVVPGLTAWYYFTRARIIRRVLAESPEWAIQAVRAAA